MSQDQDTMTERRQIEVELPNATDLVMIRTFDAPRELVFRMWNDPEVIPHFWGPRGTTTRVEKYDLREGGTWRMINIGVDGTEHPFSGEFRKVEAPRFIEWTFRYEPAGPDAGVESITFEEHDGRTTIRTVSYFGSTEERQGVLDSGMQKGANDTYDRFEELLEAELARSS